MAPRPERRRSEARSRALGGPAASRARRVSGPSPATKAAWRREIAASFRRLTPDASRAAAEAVAAVWHEVEAWRSVERVALYAALPDELDLGPVAARIAASGRPVLWPRVEGDQLVFAACAADVRRPGAFGVLEPPASAPADPLGEGDLVVVPGRAFDQRGVRLGRGRAYYDRFLAGRSELATLGVGHEFQIVSRLPRDPHDVPVDALLTERGLRPLRPPGAGTRSRPS